MTAKVSLAGAVVWSLLAVPASAQFAPADSTAMPRFRQPASHETSRPDLGSEIKREDWALGGVAAGLVVLSLVGPEADPLDCGPCDRSAVPGYDRWAIGRSRAGVADATTALLGLFGGAVLYDLYRDPDLGFQHATASLESAALAYAVTLNLKEMTSRRRPYTFTDEATSLSGFRQAEATKSFPSGHTAVAFALGVSYLRSKGGRASTIARVLTVASLLGVGAGRVVAHYHFPSDVLAGAALGSVSAWTVGEIKF